MKSFAGIAILSIFSSGLFAEPDDSLLALEDAYFDDVPIVLSATRLAQPLTESPVAMTVIDREMIDASGARTIPDLLRLVPGFQVGNFDGNSPVATYHGHSDENSKRVQVLIDGRSVYVPSLAGIPWRDMLVSVDDIDRIEVIRGPNASTYGNNSFFAVVSIITRAAVEDQGHKVKTSVGSHDTVNAYYRYGGQNGDLDYRITVGTENDDGTDNLYDYTEADYLSYRVDYQVSTDSHLSYQGGFKDLSKGDNEPPPEQDVDVAYAYQWLKWDRQISGRHSISLQYYYNLHDESSLLETMEVNLGAPIDPFVPSLQLDIKSQRHDLEFNHYYTVDNFRLVSGLSYRQDLVYANQVFDDNAPHRNNLGRAFTHFEWRVTDDFLINAGGMVENNDISGTDVSPRLSFITHVNDTNTLRLGVSKATRTPILFEEYANYRLIEQLTQNGGQPLSPAIQNLYFGGTDLLTDYYLISSGDLMSEEITSYELGYITQLLNNKMVIDVKLFRDRTDKLITLTVDVPVAEDNADGEASDFQNAYKTETDGIEISFDYRPTRSFRIYGYYAYVDIDATLINPLAETRDERRLEVSAPSDTYGLMLIKHFDNDLDIGISYFRVSDMDWLDRTGSSGDLYRDRSAQPYEKLDLNISKTERWANNNNIKYTLSFQNLLDEYYDYNKTRYADPTETIVVPPSFSIPGYGSLQDTRFYFDLSISFN